MPSQSLDMPLLQVSLASFDRLCQGLSMFDVAFIALGTSFVGYVSVCDTRLAHDEN
jgi:hypothetical protein